MNSPNQLATQIRFHLETLGETNAHHAFEQLCVGLTRRRIVSNIIPATGPVSAGGDGGRDAESFWSILANELPDASFFSAFATDDAVVLAVTAQRTNVPRKIRSDIAKICGTGEKVDRVIYFTIVPIDTAKRHELQAGARERYSVALEIWDAQAIATEVASPDLFYLAVDYLHVSSSLAPPPEDAEAKLPQWYIEARSKWRTRSAHAGSTGEFVDLREGLRFSSLHLEARADLPDWLASARALRDAANDDVSLVNRVDYEIVIATGFGLNTLRPVDSVLRNYFARLASKRPDAGVLVESITLLRLAQATQPRGGTTVTIDEVAAWADGLEQLITRELADVAGENARAELLTSAAILALGPREFAPGELDDIPIAGPKMSDLYEQLSAAKREGRSLPAAPLDAQLRDLNSGMAHLVELLETLPAAPMAPLDELMSMFDLTAPALIDHPAYSEVRSGLDEVTVERAGKAAAGERAQSRAIALLQAHRPLDALREIHAAKLNWLNGDAAEGSAIMMLLASDVYSDLGLPLAAKQYAMSAASIAKATDDPRLAGIMARAFILTATYEHQAGQWLTATRTFRFGIWAQSQFASEPWNFGRYPHLEDMVFDQCVIVRAATGLRPGLLQSIEPVIRSTNLDQLIGPILAEDVGAALPDEKATVDSADRAGLGRPFSDAGPVREYSWAALGNVWVVTTRNDRVHVLAAERFVAATQVTLGDLAAEDLLLVPGEIRIEIEVSPTPVDLSSVFMPASERGHSANGHRVRLTSAAVLAADADQLEVASAALQVIISQFLLSRPVLEVVMERTFERGLPHMLTCVRPYDDLVDVHKDAFYEELQQLPDGVLEPGRPRSPKPAQGLTPRLPAHAAGYDHEASLEAIRQRYQMLRPPVRLTLPRLGSQPHFMEIAAKLRAEGWKDWHILTAVANIVVNGRAAYRGMLLTSSPTQADIDKFRLMMREEERLSDPETPIDQFAEDEMWFHLSNAAVASAGGLGLELRLDRYEPHAFLNVLGDRFNYWEDDVDHEPLW